MTDPTLVDSLSAAIQLYFDLHYTSDTAGFDRVFRATAQLHGLRDGTLVTWSADTYRRVIEGRPSPRSLGAPREDEILLIDLAAPTQALVKLRVRVNTTVFVDYLTYHRVDGAWLVTNKAFHIERQLAAA
jgi:hypothetical protein